MTDQRAEITYSNDSLYANQFRKMGMVVVFFLTAYIRGQYITQPLTRTKVPNRGIGSAVGI